MTRNNVQVAATRHPEAGFTLVEVMSALAILAVAMTAVFATFTTQQKSFTIQNRVVEMQQNLRQAAEYMVRDIRLAGYGIPDNVTVPNGAIAAGVTTMRSLYATDSTTGPDQIYVLYLYDMDDSQPPTTVTAQVSSPYSSSTPFSVSSTAGFIPMDLVFVTDGLKADLFQADNGATVANPVLHTQGNFNASANHGSFPASGYAAGSVFSKARLVRYFIDNTTDPSHPTLMVDRLTGEGAQPLADDIEDMQLTYGLDTNADGVVDTWTPTPAATTQIRQVRLQLLARTRIPDKGWSETRPALGNRAAGTTADGYRRRIVDVVVDVRNSGV
jgi:type IV pilus assembly protein PilW